MAVLGFHPAFARFAQAQQLNSAVQQTSSTGQGSSATLLSRRRPRIAVSARTLVEARAAHAALARAQTAAQTPSTIWQPVGPAQVSTAEWNLLSGPVTSLAADPSDSTGNTLYVGTGGGGVWKSTNAAGSPGGASFAPLTDSPGPWSSAALASLSIGSVSVQPGGTGVILAGTGDPNDGMGSWYGAGILRSTNGGTTWSLIPSTIVDSYGYLYSFLGSAFAGFAWSTTNPGVVVAAVTESGNEDSLGTWSNDCVFGLYYSQDSGATWQMATIEDGTQVIQGEAYESSRVGNPATSVIWNPARRAFIAAIRFHGYYQSSDGITWTRMTSQPGLNLTTAQCPTNNGGVGSPACPIYRGALAVQPITGDTFALTIDSNNQDQGLWQDACRLTSSGACSSSTVQFGTRIIDAALQTPFGSGTIAQAYYNFWLAAVPSRQDTLLFAGTQDIFRCSLANSCTWRNATNTATCAAAQVFPYQHAIDSTFASLGLLYFGNDGGLWRSTDDVAQKTSPCTSDDAAHFQNLNSGIGSLAEVEDIAEDPATPSTWLAALGNLGTAAPATGSSSAWNQVLNGDGTAVAIDPLEPNNWYATSEFGVGINRCTQGTACSIEGFGSVAIGESEVENDYQTQAAAWILDPRNTENMLLGTCRVWRGPATGVGWSQNNLISGMLDKGTGPFCDGNAEIRSLAAAPITSGTSSGAEQLYAGMTGTFEGGGIVPGHLFTATVNNGSQASSTTWADRYSSPVSNSDGDGTKFNPENYGVSSIYADPHDPTGQTVYVTLEGVSSSSGSGPSIYRSTDAGAHWMAISSNLPIIPVNAVLVDPNNANIVYVALDTGVYITQNVTSCVASTGACWNVYGSGLPPSPVVALMAYNEGSTQTLRAGTWGRGIWQVPLATAGIAPTTATLLPATLTFPSQQVSTVSAVQTLTLTNTGTLNLNISSLTITGDFAETDDCSGQSLAPAATCKVSITFDPSQNGARTGQLTVFANVSGGQLTASLSGTGLAAASLVLTPASLTFTGTLIGLPSAAQYVTLANTGGESSALTSEAVSGDFSISANTCSSSVAANNSCTLGIVFTPTVSGTRSGVLTVVDAIGTQTAQLSGTGLAPATDALAPSSLAFAAQQVGTVSSPQQLTLSNSGDQPLTSIAVIATGDFTPVNNCGATLQPHGTCSVSVSYAPTVAGAETGTLTVTDEFRKQSVALTGTGVAPPGASALPASISFGPSAIGSTSAAQTVTVANSGGTTLTTLAATVTAGFAIATNTCSATLAAGATCQLGVTFSPTAAGSVTGTLTISAANLTKSLTVSLSGQGDDFTLAVSGSSSTIITSGQTASFALQLEGLAGTTGTVALTCTGAPQNSTCTLNPSSIVVTGANSSSVTASIATGVATSTSAANRSPTLPPANPITLPVLGLFLPFALPFGIAGSNRSRRAHALLLLALLLFAAGCGVSASSGGSGSGGSGGSGGGGSGGTENQTPSGTYTLTIKGTMSNITHSVQVTVTVQ